MAWFRLSFTGSSGPVDMQGQMLQVKAVRAIMGCPSPEEPGSKVRSSLLTSDGKKKLVSDEIQQPHLVVGVPACGRGSGIR